MTSPDETEAEIKKWRPTWVRGRIAHIEERLGHIHEVVALRWERKKLQAIEEDVRDESRYKAAG
jgi:hypothetical protein